MRTVIHYQKNKLSISAMCFSCCIRLVFSTVSVLRLVEASVRPLTNQSAIPPLGKSRWARLAYSSSAALEHRTTDSRRNDPDYRPGRGRKEAMPPSDRIHRWRSLPRPLLAQGVVGALAPVRQNLVHGHVRVHRTSRHRRVVVGYRCRGVRGANATARRGEQS